MVDLTGKEIGPYRIRDEVGRGGMATIYRAEQVSMGREVAIKILHRSLIEQDKTFLERFFREAQIVAHLQHPYILPVYDFGESDGAPYIVMGYMGWGTLADYIRQQKQMRISEVVRMIRQMAEALDYAHQQGVIHRDFKPGNVLLDAPGNVYLADFGLAKSSQSHQLTVSGIIGTPDYIAPDWTAGGGDSPTVDIYALGVTLYQMLTGELPFRADTPMGVLLAHANAPIPNVIGKRPDLPEAVQSVINTALAKSPAQRYASAGSLADDLAAAVEAGSRFNITPISPPSAIQPPFFSCEHMRLNLLAAKDVLGTEQFNGILILAGLEEFIECLPPDDLKLNFPVEKYSQLWHAIYEIYGSRGLRAVGRMAGEGVHFHSITTPVGKIRRQAAQALLKMMPLEEKVRTGLKFLARIFPDQGIETDETDTHWIWRVRYCPNCWGWKTKDSVCYSWIGYLQAEIAWGSDGMNFRIVETECRAKGDPACVFLIEKKPV